MSAYAGFQSGETSSIPGACVPHACFGFSGILQADILLVFCALAAQPLEIRLTRPTRNPPSHRRVWQTRWSRVVHVHPPLLSSHRETWMTAARSARSLEIS